MLFHTLTFLIFFVTFLAVYLPFRKRGRGVEVLLVASNIFYGWWDWRFLALLWLTIIVDFTLGQAIQRAEDLSRRRLLLLFSLTSNLGVLAIFKYYNFFVSGAVALGIENAQAWSVANLVVPVGLSFYTFQSMSYTIDIFRGKTEPETSLIRFASFVCYFPQLVAGPIDRIGHLLPQIISPAKITAERISTGVLVFSFGFFRKGIADTIGLVVDPIFANIAAAPPTHVILAVIGFGMQLYLDFTGYVDMARGLSRALGIEMKVNFNAPYLSTSVRDFWRRWHISLSQWLRDYLYISLGGSRHGLPRHLSALMLTMVLGGLWHGAGINFIIWGALHGLYLVTNTLWSRTRISYAFSELDGYKRLIVAIVRRILTCLAVNYAWLYFRAPNFSVAMEVNRKILDWLSNPSFAVSAESLASGIVAIALFVSMELAINRANGRVSEPSDSLRLRGGILHGALAGLLFAIGLILHAGNQTQQFIYFQF